MCVSKRTFRFYKPEDILFTPHAMYPYKVKSQIKWNKMVHSGKSRKCKQILLSLKSVEPLAKTNNLKNNNDYSIIIIKITIYYCII